LQTPEADLHRLDSNWNHPAAIGNRSFPIDFRPIPIGISSMSIDIARFPIDFGRLPIAAARRNWKPAVSS
jgi:hypothetical protein